MPNMMRQPIMVNMAGGMSGNVQQPMANFGYGNNMNFYGPNKYGKQYGVWPREQNREQLLTISGASFEYVEHTRKC